MSIKPKDVEFVRQVLSQDVHPAEYTGWPSYPKSRFKVLVAVTVMYAAGAISFRERGEFGELLVKLTGGSITNLTSASKYMELHRGEGGVVRELTVPDALSSIVDNAPELQEKARRWFRSVAPYELAPQSEEEKSSLEQALLARPLLRPLVGLTEAELRLAHSQLGEILVR